jgi:colanic acid/amylovoran biosynthesis glycosyltransferase
VRRRAWESVGGFAQGVRSGGDTDFCWRLQDAGWSIGSRPEAGVTHRHRETLATFLRVAVRYAAGRAWLRRRYSGSFPDRPGARDAVRSAASAARWMAKGRLKTGVFRAVDAAVTTADLVGEQLANRPPAANAAPGAGAAVAADVIVLVDTFPALSETFVAAEVQALGRAGHAVRVEALRRPVRQELKDVGVVPTGYVEDDSVVEKLAALVWLISRHPLGCARDVIQRRRWRRQEEVMPLRGIAPVARRLADHPAARLYCHFASGAALTTMRIARLSGRPYALTAHAFDIFRDAQNLTEKLEHADVVLTGCRYNVDYLRSLVGTAAGQRIHEVVMGVDLATFARATPPAGGRTVIGVGRLVEKKGFADLITAVASLSPSEVGELLLVGDGPLREELASLAQRLGAADRVTFVGAVEHAAIRALIEHADVLAMPCVVAKDGDRDSMPVVVKEALALETPVVATEEVGLPELVRPAWGRLVAPRQPAELAAALAEVLALPLEERMALGRAGRAHVETHCNVDRETAKLASLLGLQQ